MLRLKMCVNRVARIAGNDGAIASEEVQLSAVYSNDPKSANAQWSKWTPAAQLNMTINNPDALGKILPGQFVYVDISETDKDSL